MKKLHSIIIVIVILLSSCSYDEEIPVHQVQVQLIYPEKPIGSYEGARVELKDYHASTFISYTNTEGLAIFQVPAGLYEATTSSVYLTDDYRYIFNGMKSQNIISPDDNNLIEIKLKMTKKRIVH